VVVMVDSILGIDWWFEDSLLIGYKTRNKYTWNMSAYFSFRICICSSVNVRF
jgi:hypothetical protein